VPIHVGNLQFRLVNRRFQSHATPGARACGPHRKGIIGGSLPPTVLFVHRSLLHRAAGPARDARKSWQRNVAGWTAAVGWRGRIMHENACPGCFFQLLHSI
jgi:hypothetical protein